jgi:hypothetical protein
MPDAHAALQRLMSVLAYEWCCLGGRLPIPTAEEVEGPEARLARIDAERRAAEWRVRQDAEFEQYLTNVLRRKIEPEH